MAFEIDTSRDVENVLAAGRDINFYCGGNVSVGMEEYVVSEDDHENDSTRGDQNEQDEVQELLKMIDAVKKKVEAQEKLRAIKYCWCELDAKIKTMPWDNEPQSEQQSICAEIRTLTKKFIEYGNTDMARKSIRCEFYLIKLFYVPGKHRLEKLQHLGVSMQKIANKENGGQFKAEYDFMDDILDEMQGVTVHDVDVELKCQLVTCFSISYAFCCIETGNFSKAIEILHRAIFTMHFVFGKEFKHNKFLAICYQNIGVSYQRLGKRNEAKTAYKQAEEIKEQVDAWKKVNVERPSAVAVSSGTSLF